MPLSTIFLGQLCREIPPLCGGPGLGWSFNQPDPEAHVCVKTPLAIPSATHCQMFASAVCAGTV